jgi:hypothetical protein
MENLTHTFVGAALAECGLKRVTPLATTTLLIAANLPDIDVVSGNFRRRSLSRMASGNNSLVSWLSTCRLPSGAGRLSRLGKNGEPPSVDRCQSDWNSDSPAS